MRLLQYRMPKDWNLYQWGDNHEGSAFVSDHGIRHVINTILEDPIGYSFHIGDAAESRTIDHPYYVHEHSTGTVLAQIFRLIEMFKPLTDAKDDTGLPKLLWMNKGNHEKSVDNYGNTTEAICSQLGIDYGTWTAKPTFRDRKSGKVQFKGYFCHGFSKRHVISSQAQDPKLRRAHEEMIIKKMLYPMASDALVMGCGHYHILRVNSPMSELILTDDGKKIKHGYTRYKEGDYIHPDLRWYAVSGSFYKQFVDGMDSYAEMAGYRPTEMGWIKYVIRDGVVQSVEPIVLPEGEGGRNGKEKEAAVGAGN